MNINDINVKMIPVGTTPGTGGGEIKETGSIILHGEFMYGIFDTL
jgi:hypothetical protein